MELRSCTHLHFIRTVKAGLEVKIPNVVRGVPALKFKPVKELYNSGGANSNGLLPELSPKVEVEDLTFDCDSIQIESRFIPVAESTIRVEPVTSQCNFSPGDAGRKVDLDDLTFGDMTLKQIKATCKAKKRKRYTFVNLGKESIETCSILREDHPYSQPEDECDLLEPLSLWKSRLSKKRKSKRKVMKKKVCTAFQDALSAVKSEQFPSDQDFIHSEDDLPGPIDIKVEFPVHNYADFQNVIPVVKESSFSSNNDGCGSMVVSNKEPGMATDHVFYAGDLDFCTTEPLCCISDASSYNYMEFTDSHSYHDVMTLGREIIMVDDPQMTDYELSDMPLLEYKEQKQNISPLQLDDPCESIIPLLDYVEPCCIISPLQHFEPCQTITSGEDHSSDAHDDNRRFSPMHEILHQSCSESQVPMPNVAINNTVQVMELGDADDVILLEDKARDDFPSDIKASVICDPLSSSISSRNPNTQSNQDSSSDCFPAGFSTIAEENQYLFSVRAESTRNNCSTICPSHTSEELVPSVVDENFRHSVRQHPPENLLSTRKVISPTSQEKLRLAMESSKLDDLEYYRCMGKLCYRKKSENKNKSGGVKGPNQARRVEVIDQTVTKLKNERKMLIPRANQKVHPSRALPSISTGCPSIESLSENAILFSERQMVDFKCIASKLSQELKSMRDIVEIAFQSGVYPAAPLKYNAEQVRIAIRNATRAEETTRSWLSAMARNCSRFCKIMKLTEKSSAPSENVVHKERKKIVFADEAGGKLCHVKVFDNSTPSLSESNCEVQMID